MFKYLNIFLFSPVYVDNNCNLEVVAQRIIWGKLLNAGQSCVAPDYVMCGYDIQVRNLLMNLLKFYANFYDCFVYLKSQ